VHRRALAAVLLLLGPGACAGPATAPEGEPTTPSSAAPTSTTPAGPVTFVVVGDSITAGAEPIVGTAPAGTAWGFGEGTWLPAAVGAPLEFEGGWAVSGATTDEMRSGVVPTGADVVVVVAGTNDLLRGVPWPTSRDNLLAIVDTVGTAHVVLATVPPLDNGPVQREAYDQSLRELADQEGWQLVDPWRSVERAGAWVAGSARDGVHPTQQTADRAGQVIRRAVLAAGRR
jgi:acyl-CoA thioesterase-1